MADATQLQTANPNAGMASALGSTTTSSDSGGSLFSDIGSGLSSFLNSPLGNLAEFGTLAGLGLSEASQAKSEAAGAAGQLTGAGAPYLSTGTNVLGQYNAGEPGSAGQQITAANTLGNIANTAFSNYQNGTLSPADQAALNAQTTAQKQQVAQQLANSGGTDQSALDSAYQQIDNNALIQRQNMLNAGFATGQQALTQVQSTYTNLLNNALSSSQFGLGALGEGLQLQITQDSQITQSLNNLFGQIARGFGTAMAPGGSGGGGGGSGGSGSTATNLLGKAAGSLLGGSGFTLDPSLSGATGAQASVDAASQAAAANTDAGDLAAASNQQYFDSLGTDSLGASAGTGTGIAGSAAAAGLGDVALSDVGVDAATAAPTVTGLDAGAAAGSEAGAAGGSGIGSSLAAAGPYAAAVAATAYPFIAAFGLDGGGGSDASSGWTPQQMQAMTKTLQGGAGSDPTQQYNYYAALNELMSEANNPDAGVSGQQAADLLKSMGLDPSTYYPKLPAYSTGMAGGGSTTTHDPMKA